MLRSPWLGMGFVFAWGVAVPAGAVLVSPSLQQVATGLSSPLFATHAPNDPSRLFIAERGNSGTGVAAIKILDLDSGTVLGSPFLNVSGLAAGGERGLLGLAFHPDYNNNGFFYVNVTNSSGNTEIRRYQVQGDPKTSNTANAASMHPILSYNQPNSNHNGGWLGFGPDGNLYIASGDGGGSNDPGNNGQNPNNLLGAMLRIDVDGDDFPGNTNRNYAIPNNNPFAPGGTDPGGGADEVWAYGLRNPWRNSFDRVTGDLYIADVGQFDVEEVNFQPASSTGGENYGWRIHEGTDPNPNLGDPPLDSADRVDPVYEYFHGSGSTQGISVTGGHVYRGPVEELDGLYFFSDFGNPRIWTLDTADDGSRFDFADMTSTFNPSESVVSTIVSFGEDLYGNLYVVSLNGQVFRVTGEVPHDTEDDPILPDSTGGGRFRFDDAPGDGRWFDPLAAEGFVYETDGLSSFIEVGLPSLATVPDDDGLYTVTSILGSVRVAAGDFHVFSSPVSQFTITGIDPAVDGQDPLAFPTFLAFDSFSNDFTMTPLASGTFIVPEPASWTLLLMLLSVILRLKRRPKVGPPLPAIECRPPSATTIGRRSELRFEWTMSRRLRPMGQRAQCVEDCSPGATSIPSSSCRIQLPAGSTVGEAHPRRSTRPACRPGYSLPDCGARGHG